MSDKYKIHEPDKACFR